MLESLLVEGRHVLLYSGFLGLTGYAFFRGEAPERLIGIIFVTAVAFVISYHRFYPEQPSETVELPLAFLDAAMFVALSIVAMRANRIYPLCIVAAQLITVAMHFQRVTLIGLPPIAYWVMIRLPSYIQLATFAIGIAAHRYRLRHGINAPPWRVTSRR